MSFLQSLPSLPLLRRELTELANRRRTYIVRFLTGLAVLTTALLVLTRQLAMIAQRGSSAASPINAFLGTGGELFVALVPLLFYTIRLLMPALCASAIAAEKEQNTLGTLLLTRLRPSTIILEKLGSRLVPMFSFLLLSFPVIAFVYSLGGVDQRLLFATLWLLFCECLLFASLSMMFSSWCRTGIGAFVSSYVFVAGLWLFTAELPFPVLTPFDTWMFLAHGNGGGLFYRLVGNSDLIAVMMSSAVSLGMSLIFLLVARLVLFRRAFVTSTSLLISLFRSVDRFFVRLNSNRLTRNIEIIPDSGNLPEFDPIAWRERTRKSLGKARYLFRILIAMEFPTLFICLLAAIGTSERGFTGLSSLLMVLWGLVALIVMVRAATLVSSEYARETIQALLSTPMTSRELLQQKVAGIRRLQLVLMCPILTVHLTQVLVTVEFARGVVLRSSLIAISYLLLASLTTYVLLSLITWVSLL
ncbi:MAG: hypothetical protein KDA85_21255, partial [Planctomycetaceae bacterium]|nr:hypothetical protein [Planctomycetaceae bacterium]